MTNVASKKLIRVRARTHAEFLNKVFGTKYGGWMKCAWNYSDDIIVWMVRFSGRKEDFENRLLDGGEKISEMYFGTGQPTWLDDNIAKVAVSVEGDGASRTYVVKGLFIYSPYESSLRKRIFHKVPDEQACVWVPQIYESEKI